MCHTQLRLYLDAVTITDSLDGVILFSSPSAALQAHACPPACACCCKHHSCRTALLPGSWSKMLFGRGAGPSPACGSLHSVRLQAWWQPECLRMQKVQAHTCSWVRRAAEPRTWDTIRGTHPWLFRRAPASARLHAKGEVTWGWESLMGASSQASERHGSDMLTGTLA